MRIVSQEQAMTPHLKRMQERGVHLPNTERLSRTMQQLKAAIEVLALTLAYNGSRW